ncbi:hypothetical protein CTZ27_12555 [Streptomyces griseocarneus]|nr:hypothetical protein CTZ27_12555 [Streptomyces griseocarneus]
MIAAVCAAAVGVTGIGAAHADAQDHRPAVVAADGVTEQQIEELARYLQAIAEGEIFDSNGKFDYEKTRAEFGAEFADALKQEFAKVSELPEGVQRSYVSCLLGAVGLGGLTGVSQTIVDKLKNKKWSDAARLLTKEAAKRGIKVAVKGGVVGMAATLGASAIWCATPWASDVPSDVRAAA